MPIKFDNNPEMQNHYNTLESRLGTERKALYKMKDQVKDYITLIQTDVRLNRYGSAVMASTELTTVISKIQKQENTVQLNVDLIKRFLETNRSFWKRR